VKPHLVLVPPPSDPGAPSLGSAFRRYGPYVAKVAYRLLGRHDEVEDVVQDVFIEAARGLSMLREPEALKGWLAAICVRTCSRRLKVRRLRRFVSWDEDPTYDDVASGEASPEERVLLAQVYRALDALPVDARVAWTLRYIEQEQLETIAARCACSLATVKRRISDAERRLAKVIGS